MHPGDNFRLNAYTVFLTYPQSGDTAKDDLMAFLLTVGRNPEYGVVSLERHEDGSPHLHAVFKYKTKLNVRNPKHFDFNGLHPNIQSARKFTDVVKYCKKDGDFIEHGDQPSEFDIFFDYHFRY